MLNGGIYCYCKPCAPKKALSLGLIDDKHILGLEKELHKAKTNVWDLKSATQEKYMELCKINLDIDTQWHTLITSHPENLNGETTTQIIDKASALLFNGYIQMFSMQGFGNHSQHALELGSSFEGEAST